MWKKKGVFVSTSYLRIVRWDTQSKFSTFSKREVEIIIHTEDAQNKTEAKDEMVWSKNANDQQNRAKRNPSFCCRIQVEFPSFWF